MYLTQENYLRGIQLPQETSTYKPVSHGQLIDLISESVHQAGFKIGENTFTTAREGNVANARYSISNVKDDEMGLQIGWQNSYDKSLTLKFAIGAHVFICQNGMVVGDMGALKRKHTGDIQSFTPQMITESIKKAGDTFELIQTQRELLKTVEIDTRTAAELVGRMIVEENFIQSTQLNIIRHELKTPTFDYNSDNSLWQLYQHTTFAMRDIHPSLWMKNHMSAHEFFMGAYNEIQSTPTTTVNIPLDLFADKSNEMDKYGIDPKRQLKLFENIEG